MKIETKLIRDGAMIGDDVWICDYRRPDLQKKPLRKIAPTLVRVVSNDDLQKNKKVYYSITHFKQVKNGKLLARVISAVDNTGFRSYCGNELSVFTDKQECINHFNVQCSAVELQLSVEIENATRIWEEQLQELQVFASEGRKA